MWLVLQWVLVCNKSQVLLLDDPGCGALRAGSAIQKYDYHSNSYMLICVMIQIKGANSFKLLTVTQMITKEN